MNPIESDAVSFGIPTNILNIVFYNVLTLVVVVSIKTFGFLLASIKRNIHRYHHIFSKEFNDNGIVILCLFPIEVIRHCCNDMDPE